MKTIQELKEKTVSELKKLLEEKKENLRKLRFEIASKQAKNNSQIRKDRRDAARILTLLSVSGEKSAK